MSNELQFWLGLAAGAVLVVIGAALPRFFQTGSTVKVILRAITVSGVLIGTVVALRFATMRVVDTGHQATSPPDPTVTLARRLTQHEWALEGESCDRDGIRFAVEGNELVAYPRGAGPIRYLLVSANGQTLTTSLSGRLIRLWFRADGFTHSDSGYNRWYHLCG